MLALYWLLLAVATHLPKVPQPMELEVSDKWQHYVAYCGLAFLMTFWLAARRAPSWFALLCVLAAAMAYGALDEVTQPLFGRDAELLDFRADTLGAASGIMLYLLAGWLWRKCL
jgi:VanZ family protein